MNTKNYTIGDVGLIKLAVLFGTLFFISVIPEFANWVIRTHWAWFIIIAVLLAIKPILKTFKK
ncbi:hypothetical protein FJZ20_02395 [Candidatus Pacearchaeota archaeon]|nr:hypothetical protein [Candidatus Pacearchaeota archaeon]